MNFEEEIRTVFKCGKFCDDSCKLNKCSESYAFSTLRCTSVEGLSILRLFQVLDIAFLLCLFESVLLDKLCYYQKVLEDVRSRRISVQTDNKGCEKPHYAEKSTAKATDMNIPNQSSIEISLNVSETLCWPYKFWFVNATGLISHLTKPLAPTDSVLYNTFLANLTDAVFSEINVPGLNLSRLPTGCGRLNGSLKDSPLQMVSKRVADKVCFILVMVLIPSFSVFGSVGNILSLRVLVHHRMRNATNMVLAALAVSDLLFLLHALYFSFLKLYALRNPLAGDHLRSMTFPVLGPYGSVVTARITTGLTTMLSVERLVAVYNPIKAKVICGKAMTVTCITMIYLVTAVVFIPSALKYHSHHVTVNNQTTFIMGLTELGRNDLFYSVYGNILNVLFRLVPILILILVNILIAQAIRRTWWIRRTISSGGSACYEQGRITVMLLMVSLVFLVCILPGAVHSIMDKVFKQYSRYGQQSNMYDLVRNVTYFLETVNSSVNFVIYMAFSTKFCRTYKQIFCCAHRENVPPSSAKTIVRFSSRLQKSSMASYRELYFLHQVNGRKFSCVQDKEVKGHPPCENRGGEARKGSVYCTTNRASTDSLVKGKRFSQHSILSDRSLVPTAAGIFR